MGVEGGKTELRIACATTCIITTWTPEIRARNGQRPDEPHTCSGWEYASHGLRKARQQRGQIARHVRLPPARKTCSRPRRRRPAETFTPCICCTAAAVARGRKSQPREGREKVSDVDYPADTREPRIGSNLVHTARQEPGREAGLARTADGCVGRRGLRGSAHGGHWLRSPEVLRVRHCLLGLKRI